MTEKIVVGSKVENYKQATLVSFSQIDKIWCVDTTIPKHYNRFLRQGWKLVREYVCGNGEIIGGVFEAPERAITIRSVTKE